VHLASADELRAANAAATRALAIAHEYDHVLEIVRERAALRRELEVLGNPSTNAVPAKTCVVRAAVG
jgi:hypothetical protein